MQKKVQPVLGLQACEQIGLIKRIETLESHVNNDVLTKYDVFTGLGCLEGKQHIHLKEHAKPVVHAPRRVPVALRRKVKTELHRMEKLGVIVKQNQPTEWVNSMVVVAKKNSDN